MFVLFHISQVCNKKVEVLASMKMSEKEVPVVVGFRQGNILSTAFHPELTSDLRWHKYFIHMVLTREH